MELVAALEQQSAHFHPFFLITHTYKKGNKAIYNWHYLLTSPNQWGCQEEVVYVNHTRPSSSGDTYTQVIIPFAKKEIWPCESSKSP